MEFVNQNVYVVSVVLFILGYFLKQTPIIPNWSIPYILTVVSIAFCNFIMGISIDATIQGVLVTGLSVYAHQLQKQGLGQLSTLKSAGDNQDVEQS